jgi:hypothetical protein
MINRSRKRADELALEILKNRSAPGGVTDDDVVKVLSKWRFKKNKVRQNVIPEGH